MKRRLRFERLARIDLWRAIDWLNEHHTGLGWEFAYELDVELEKIAADPFRFKAIGKNARHRRAVLVTRFEYTVFFSVNEDEIAIASIFHPKRNPEVLKRRGIN